MTKEEFIDKAKAIYDEQFDYRYITEKELKMYSTVPILCNKHGLFYTTVYDMLNGEACFDCKKNEIEEKDD